LTWNVFNPNSQNHPYVYAQWWSTQSADRIALVGNTQFKTKNNPQQGSTFGDDNITGIWWVDERLLPGEPFELVTRIRLANTCTGARTSYVPSPAVPGGYQLPNNYQINFNEAIDRKLLVESIRISPNPVEDKVMIKSDLWVDPVEIRLVNMLGQNVIQMRASIEDGFTLNLSELAKGVYTLEVMQGGLSVSKQIMKN